MSGITRTQLRPVDPMLTDLAIEMSQDATGKVVDVAFTPKQTPGETGTMFYYDSDALFRNYNALRANPGEAAVISQKLTKGTFSQEQYSLRTPVTDRDRQNAISPVDLDQDAARLVTECLMLDREIRCKNAVALIDATNATASPLWNAPNATPLLDMETACQAFQARCGKRPTHLIFAPCLWANVLSDETGTAGAVISDRVKYTLATSAKNITPALVGQLLGIPNVIVADMLYSAAEIDDATVAGEAGITTGTYIWDTQADGSAQDQIILLYVDPQAGQKGLTFGKAFQSRPLQVSRYREDAKETDWVEVSVVEDLKIIASACEYRIKIV